MGPDAGDRGPLTPFREIAPAKLNLALHVRGMLPDGRHRLETIFAFCTDGDRLVAEARPAGEEPRLAVGGPFADELCATGDNLVIRAALALRQSAAVQAGATIHLDKRLPVASGMGGGSADAAAALRLLTAMWRIDPAHAIAVAPQLGSDVPACLLSLPARGEEAGDRVEPVALAGLAGMPVLLVNPRVGLSTAAVFEGWDGVDRGGLSDWRTGRNDLEPAAIALAPAIADVLDWLRARSGAEFIRMSGSGATCFALFGSELARDEAAAGVPGRWWHMATALR